MSKERYNQIIDEIYNLYAGLISLSNCVALNPQAISEEWAPDITEEMSKEDFIKKIKIDKKFTEEFAESLGIEFKIEERELSSSERWKWYGKNGGPNGKTLFIDMIVYQNEENNSHIKSWLEKYAPNVPTKLITLTYQNEKIKFYE
jgi:hypothetical protein